jgi:carbonic anhydrase/acetyltransferase-like protein (isoleucine patch superfamily)
MSASPARIDGPAERRLWTSAQRPGQDPSSPDTDLPAAGLKAVTAVLKGVGIVLGLTVAALPGLSCWIEARLSSRAEIFFFWGQAFALMPGLPGNYLRKCFYFLTLQSCSLRCDLGFLSYFSDRRTEVGRGAYVGFGACIGLASLGDGCLVGSRASIINGGWQHTLGPDGRLTPFDRASAPRTQIGAETWIGEGAIIMADVGSRCIIGAGSVVSSPVPDGCLVAGNPARFLRRLVEATRGQPESQAEGLHP